MGGAQDSLTRARAALKSAGVAQSESFEAAFNTACAAVAAGDDSAHHLLDAAHTKGQETLVDDDVGEEVCMLPLRRAWPRPLHWIGGERVCATLN